MRRLPAFLFIFLLLYLSFVIYWNRALLFSRFDETYWKDKYEQSQWKLPLSQRTIGDDGLYMYEGYRLIRGGDPITLNAEVPPLGKYLIGICILLFGNAHVFGFLTTLFLIASTYVLSKIVFRQTLPALIIAVLLATDPLIINQTTLTMMDALQTLFLMLFLTVLFQATSLTKNRRIVISALCGLLLGLFSETKVPLLAPVLVMAGIVYLWKQTKHIRDIAMFLLCAFAGYLLPYAGYFLHGYSFIDWLKLQKWMISFYSHGNISPTWGSSITTLIAGYYQNLFSHGWERAAEWSPAWAVLLFSSLASIAAWVHSRNKDQKWGILFFTLSLILGIYTVIPFWTRYLVAVLPLLYIAAGATLMHLPKRVMFILVFALLLVNVTSTIPRLITTPRATAAQVIYNIEHMFFTDLYEDTTMSFRARADRETFRRFGLTTMAQGEIEHIEITPEGALPSGFASPQTLNATVTFFTRQLGSFTGHVSIPFVREDGRWRIPWQWSYMIPDLTETRVLETTVIPARRGTIHASDKKPLAQDTAGYAVWVTPEKIDKSKEEALLSLLETVFDGRQPKVAIHQRIVGNTLSDRPVVIGVIPHPKADPNVNALASFSGVTLTDALFREIRPNNVVEIGNLTNTAYSECCTYYYSTTNYDGVSGTEKIKNEILKGINGGRLILKDTGGVVVRTFIEQTTRDGTDTEP